MQEKKPKSYQVFDIVFIISSSIDYLHYGSIYVYTTPPSCMILY